MKPQNTRGPRRPGFTLLELMIVLLILSLIVGAVFSQLNLAQQRLSTEETRLDDFQQARDFVDQFFRDINQIGTPNTQLFDTTQTFSPGLTTQITYPPQQASAYINDYRFAVGLTKIDSNEIHFEGSVNGDGTVQSIVYMLNGNNTCALCMQRSQINKINGDPLLGQNNPNWGTEVNDIISNTVFTYYQYDGTQVTTLPVDYTTLAGSQTLANVKTIQINLTIRNPKVLDKQTGMPIETSFQGEVSLNNCSMLATGQNMSCQ
jgi:prepilin-type N-terminal cleavage/methylation domain-containing protein